MLISYGEDHISSSLAGILVSTAPIYAFLLAVVITPEERAKRIGAVGVGIGIAGVVLLLGVDAGGGTAALVGGAMVALASLGYAAGAFLIKRKITGQAPIVLVTATMARQRRDVAAVRGHRAAHRGAERWTPWRRWSRSACWAPGSRSSSSTT